ncbi:MAG: CpsD/CapB family tyrosine-protein kinase [Deltaproteobacteria bacterium]
MLVLAAASPDVASLEPAVEALMRELPKGWVLERKGLPAGMRGAAIGPDGERVSVSILSAAVTADLVASSEARAWLIDALGVKGGEVETGGPLGAVVVSGRLDGGRTLLAWILAPRYLVTWIGPPRRAGAAKKRAYRLAERLRGRGSKRSVSDGRLTGAVLSDRDRKRRKRPAGNEQLPQETMPAQGSQMFSGKAGMMRLPDTIESGRRAAPEGARTPKSARQSWSPPAGSSPAPTSTPQNRALVKGQTISLTDTAISAMPSDSKDLVLLHERDGTFASELRILATRMEDLKNRLGYKSFLVTSVGDGDGKTVAASNLALAMSEDSDRKIALVDANFRNPRAADLFNLDKRRGLLGALKGEYPLSQCVARVLGRNLIVLHAGGNHDNPASILSSPKFKSLLAELYQAVDFMIVDAPSAIPYADVPLLTQHVDAVLMVGAAHRTRRAKLDEALETVGRARVVGSIFMERSKKDAKKASAGAS